MELVDNFIYYVNTASFIFWCLFLAQCVGGCHSKEA